jgi:L-malate glycosyltransferase
VKTVVVLQYRLFHYRMDLFEKLKARCLENSIDLILVVGNPYVRELAKKDEGYLSWAVKVKNLYFPVGEKKDLCWQPVPRQYSSPDLIVFMQENRLLSNYYWICRRLLGGGVKTAYWGHGRDFQSRAPGGFREQWKRFSLRLVDWWFAYTDISKQHVLDAGFPQSNVTVLNNAIDVRGLRRDWDSISEHDISTVRAACNVTDDSLVGLFCGSLYSDKKLDLLVSASILIHQKLPNFRLIVVGDGPDLPKLKRDLANYDWAICVGAKRGVEKAAYFGISDVVLNPGLVGLHILDGFAMGLPMITTNNAVHSPEIAYMEDGINGLMVDDDPQSYADAVVRVLGNPESLRSFSESALQSSEKYTLEAMVENFVKGFCSALDTPYSANVD